MKKFLLIAATLLVALVTSCTGGKYETVKGDPSHTRIYTLDNGLKVYMSVNKKTPRIQTYIAVKVGGKNDPAETTGLAHYFEHLMFKGTETFGTSDYAAEKPMLDEIESLFETYRATTDEAQRAQIYHRIDSISYEASKLAIPNEYDKLMSVIGADGTNAFTSNDETVYVENIPSNQIENWAKVQADRFQHPVIRGFHTELETIYEEKNMSLTQDNRKMWEGVLSALYPHHPYGTQTVLGTQEHLKNPSITNVKAYHKTWYVPNNMAVCVSGDFDPDEMITIIEKYFGGMQPNPELPQLAFEPETPITEPVVKDVYGLESEYVYLAWRLPAAADKSNDVADIASSIIYNGKAGLIDLDVNQQQKLLMGAAFDSNMADYGMFIAIGYPKQGQSLEDVKEILLGEVAKLRSGDFDEDLIEASINNYKKEYMAGLEDINTTAMNYVNAFIEGEDWADCVGKIDRCSKVTKADVVEWANKYLGENSYVVLNKRQGVDNSVKKVSAPKITPIVTNRDKQSDFLAEIQNTPVKPIEPVFVNFKKEMSTFTAAPGVEVLYKQNADNDLFDLEYVFDINNEQDPELAIALDYLSYLGTATKSHDEIATELYELASDYRCFCGSSRTYITMNGLGESMDDVMEIVEDLILNAKGDDQILAALKADIIKSRADNKLSQMACFSALRRYVAMGGEAIAKKTLTNEQVLSLTSDELLAKVRGLFDKQHEVIYYGPASEKQLKKELAENHIASGKTLEATTLEWPEYISTDGNSVVLAQYDAKQLYYSQFSCDDRALDPSAEAGIRLYNSYFGGGMNTIVFQEMREARSLAYSAWASLSTPFYKSGKYSYNAFIATQNDKMRQAIEAFDDIINNMPESEAAFAIAKESLITSLRTSRTVGEAVLQSYIDCRDLGLSEPLDRQVFEAVQNMTLEDVKAVQQQWVKDRKYTYAILGDIKDLDTKYLSTLGPVKTVSLEEIFGY